MPTGVGQFHCLMVPHEEAQVSLLFEHGNLLAQRRLVDTQPRGCTGKIQFFGQRNRGLQKSNLR
jgi:hypothetical protein